MAVAAPAAPAAPAAAPAPAPSPAPTPAPAPTPSPAPSPSPSPASSFGDLDKKAAARKAAPPKPDAPAAPAPAPAAPVPDPKKADPKQLRQELDRVSNELAARSAKVTEYEAKIKDYERRGIDTTAITERLAAAEKREQEAQAQIRRLKREVTPEFKKQYDEPFNQTAEFARQIVTQLRINEGTPDEPNMRPATWNDFVSLYNAPIDKAIEAAKAQYGDASSVVIQHLLSLHQLNYNRQEALKGEQAKWKEMEAEEIATTSKNRDFLETTWKKVNEDISNSHPEWYADDPKDQEGNELLKEGFALVDSDPKSIQERLIRDAHVRLKAAAFARVVNKLTRALETIEEKDAQIAELKASKPGQTHKPSSGSGETPPATKSWKDDLRESMT